MAEEGSKKTWLWIVLAAVLAAVVSSGATGFVALRMAATRHGGRHAPPKHQAAAPKKLQFASLQSMVVSLPDGSAYGGSTYLQVSFKFATTSKKALQEFAAVKPAIRGQVLEFMLDQKSAILHSHDARNALKTNVLGLVNSVLSSNDPSLGDRPMQRVYITRFVTQS